MSSTMAKLFGGRVNADGGSINVNSVRRPTMISSSVFLSIYYNLKLYKDVLLLKL
jgi:hypothetical protein